MNIGLVSEIKPWRYLNSYALRQAGGAGSRRIPVGGVGRWPLAADDGQGAGERDA
jgi:hypothetical protein